jgi:hypothetical protein
MGQYYKIAIKPKDGETVYNDRKVKGCGYIMAKLREHSYVGNYLVSSVASMLEAGKCRLAWVGDYAEEDEVDKITGGDVKYEVLWGEDREENPHEFPRVRFRSVGKFLLNHDKKLFVPLTGGFFSGKWQGFPVKDPVTGKVEEGKIHTERYSPIPILTAIGNGRGGGDYFGKDEDLAGTWAWDEISVSDKVPKGYSPLKHLPKKKDS